MKKKILAAVLAVALMVAVFANSAFALNRYDLLEVLKADPDINQYPRVIAAVETQIDNFNFTSEECEYLLEQYEVFKEIVYKYGGFSSRSSHTYDPACVEEVDGLIATTLGRLGYTFAFLPKFDTVNYHYEDIIFVIYDSNGIVVFEYDGDPINETGEAALGTTGISAYFALGGGLLLVGAAIFFATKNRKNFKALVARA